MKQHSTFCNYSSAMKIIKDLRFFQRNFTCTLPSSLPSSQQKKISKDMTHLLYSVRDILKGPNKGILHLQNMRLVISLIP